MTQHGPGSPVRQENRAALNFSLAMKAVLVLGILIFSASVCAQDTGWLNPSADWGTFSNGSQAYYNDNLFAEARNGQEHRYWSYAVFIPAGSTILGIELRLDAWKTGGPAAYLYAELSWDGGNSWTTTGYRTGALGTTEATYILGGPTDKWGRSWNPSEFGTGLFCVRLRAQCGAAHRIRLDWVAVRVHYSTGLSLEVSPATLDLGTLSLADYDRGYVDSLEAQTLRISSGTTWTLTVAALTPTWRYTGDLPDPKKPCGHLLWRVEYADGPVSVVEKTFTALTTSERGVAQGSAGLVKLSLSFRLLVDYDTTWPGTYSLDFRYTLTSP